MGTSTVLWTSSDMKTSTSQRQVQTRGQEQPCVRTDKGQLLTREHIQPVDRYRQVDKYSLGKNKAWG